MIFLLYLSTPVGIDPVETNEALGILLFQKEEQYWAIQIIVHTVLSIMEE
jgi:hypothetical protein